MLLSSVTNIDVFSPKMQLFYECIQTDVPGSLELLTLWCVQNKMFWVKIWFTPKFNDVKVSNMPILI